jgi:hypothetical protein
MQVAKEIVTEYVAGISERAFILLSIIIQTDMLHKSLMGHVLSVSFPTCIIMLE